LAKLNSTNACHQSIIAFDHVSFHYEQHDVIRNLQFFVKERDFIGLIGANGSGKTTLLKMMVGLLKPTNGQIKLFDQPIHQFSDWEKIGYVPQKNAFNPMFPATVREVVQSGLYGKKQLYRRLSKQDYQKVDGALLAMRIENLASRKIGQLSGGQQQRTFLARAIVNNPELLILDEPTIGVDAETQQIFFNMIRHLHLHHHMTFVMVSHDMHLMSSYLGIHPTVVHEQLKFFVKHTHEPEDCREKNISHSIEQMRVLIGAH
jgi:zinc transport system ATP-binding protein